MTTTFIRRLQFAVSFLIGICLFFNNRHHDKNASYYYYYYYFYHYFYWMEKNNTATTTTIAHDNRTQQSKKVLRSLPPPLPPPRFAFCTLLSGIDPYDPQHLNSKSSYIGYLLNLAVVRYILHETRSITFKKNNNNNFSNNNINNNNINNKPIVDLVIILRMKRGVHDIPPEQYDFLQNKLGYRIIKISNGDDDGDKDENTTNADKNTTTTTTRRRKKEDSFSNYMMDKFEILRFHGDYDRILFFDADVIPLCRWNYLLELSYYHDDILAPNLIMSSKQEPAQGGFFILTPEEGDYEKMRNISYINSTHGFGTPIPVGDPAETIKSNLAEWTWYGARDDQGMLYHWVKYVKKNVSIVLQTKVTRWGEREDGGGNSSTTSPQIMHVVDPFPYECPNALNADRLRYTSFSPCYRDHHHYTGSRKPWQIINWTERIVNHTDPYKFWGEKLCAAWETFELPSVANVLFKQQAGAAAAGKLESYQQELNTIETYLNGDDVPTRIFPSDVLVERK